MTLYSMPTCMKWKIDVQQKYKNSFIMYIKWHTKMQQQIQKNICKNLFQFLGFLKFSRNSLENNFA